MFGIFKSPGYGKWARNYINSDEAPGKLQASVHEARKPVDILLMRLFYDTRIWYHDLID